MYSVTLSDDGDGEAAATCCAGSLFSAPVIGATPPRPF